MLLVVAIRSVMVC